MAISTIRHQEIFDAKANDQQITIIGAGATGSRIFAALLELGLSKITVYDFDVVEAHNLANQLYVHEDIGKQKVEALKHWAEKKLGHAIPPSMQFINECVGQLHELKGTIFLLTDTMSSRKEIYNHCIKGNPAVYRVIETRMASTHGNIMLFNPHTIQGDLWFSTLSNDEDTEVSACGSAISVGTTASIIANLAVWQYMHAKTNPAAGDDIIDIFLKPFTTATRTWSSLNDQAQQAA